MSKLTRSFLLNVHPCQELFIAVVQILFADRSFQGARLLTPVAPSAPMMSGAESVFC